MVEYIFLSEQMNINIMCIISFILFPLIVLISCCKNIKFDKKKTRGFSKIDSQVWKGVAAFVIFLHHYSQRIVELENTKKYADVFQIYANFSHIPVGLFFFLSGYSLLKVYKMQGKTYLQKGFIRKRFCSVFLPFFCIETIYSLVVKKSFWNYLWCLFTFHAHDDISHIARPYWFCIAILMAYAIFYIAYGRTWRNKYKIIFLFGSIFSYMAICHILNAGFWWYKSILCFGVGVLIASVEEDIWFQDNRKLIFIVSGVGMVCSTFLQICSFGIFSMISIILQTIFFSVFIYYLNDFCSPNSFIWRYVGKYSLEIYLTHIFIIRYLEYNNIGVVRFNALLNIVFIVTLSFVIGKAVEKIKLVLS